MYSPAGSRTTPAARMRNGDERSTFTPRSLYLFVMPDSAKTGSENSSVFSVGSEDHAPKLVSELGELPVHGIAVRPASPAGMGFIGGRPVFLLPGNPAACLCAYDLFAGRAIRRLGGRSDELPYRTAQHTVAVGIKSPLGRVEYARVTIGPDGVRPVPSSGASILSSTVIADGFVLVPKEREGHKPGDIVTVYHYDSADLS